MIGLFNCRPAAEKRAQVGQILIDNIFNSDLELID